MLGRSRVPRHPRDISRPGGTAGSCGTRHHAGSATARHPCSGATSRRRDSGAGRGSVPGVIDTVLPPNVVAVEALTDTSTNRGSCSSAATDARGSSAHRCRCGIRLWILQIRTASGHGRAGFAAVDRRRTLMDGGRRAGTPAGLHGYRRIVGGSRRWGGPPLPRQPPGLVHGGHSARHRYRLRRVSSTVARPWLRRYEPSAFHRRLVVSPNQLVVWSNHERHCRGVR